MNVIVKLDQTAVRPFLNILRESKTPILHQTQRYIYLIVSEPLWVRLAPRIERLKQRVMSKPNPMLGVPSDSFLEHKIYKRVAKISPVRTIRFGLGASLNLIEIVTKSGDVVLIQERPDYVIVTLSTSLWDDIYPLMTVDYEVMTRRGRKRKLEPVD